MRECKKYLISFHHRYPQASNSQNTKYELNFKPLRTRQCHLKLLFNNGNVNVQEKIFENLRGKNLSGI